MRARATAAAAMAMSVALAATSMSVALAATAVVDARAVAARATVWGAKRKRAGSELGRGFEVKSPIKKIDFKEILSKFVKKDL